MAADAYDEWVGAGLISADQAERIRAYEAIRPGRARVSLVVEALGYLGGVIMLVGASILVGMYWGDISVPLRLALAGATAVGLVVAGTLVPHELGPAADRLRSVLWALAVAATAGVLTIWSQDVLERYDEDELLVVAPLTALVAALLWWWRRTWLQQLVLVVPLLLAAAAVGLHLGDGDTAPGIAVWVVAVAWTALAWAGALPPRGSGVVLGGLGAIFGPMTISGQVGIVLGLLTAVALLVLALVARSLPLLAVAALGLLEAAPRAVVEWFPGRLSAALTLIVVGALLVGAGVWVARHRARRPPAGTDVPVPAGDRAARPPAA
ncbi:DUF2157 domain-containing protein [Nocardioides sp.]|uniref:DUF2157 domain-containing protein n=1 Tax=Nocardioides sp. TaxID=35761 RepID=UPI0037838AE5